MSRPGYPKRLHPPSKRYPTWQSDDQGALIYLGWGERDFARESIRMHCNPGWTYWILVDGNVDISLPTGIVHYTTGQGFLCGPEFAYGFPGSTKGKIKLLAWIWRDAPNIKLNCLETKSLPRYFSPDQIRFLDVLHEQTRNETLEQDTQQDRSLKHIRGMLDITFERSADKLDENMNHLHIRRARQWILNNLSNPSPSVSLARYLDMSPMTLHRIFKRELNQSPGAHFHQLKMAHCQALLKMEGYSIKRIAYEAGYRHPQDFTRAYKNFFGKPPSQTKT